jgi:glycosyltransferase involved in cell wall biosynthesis
MDVAVLIVFDHKLDVQHDRADTDAVRRESRMVGTCCSSGSQRSRVLVVLPTFNERQSLPRVIDGLLTFVREAEIVVVDDASPDGTGAWAQDLAASEPRLHVLQRPGKLGLGSAYKAGYAWGIARGFNVLVGMDSDGSHCPLSVRALLESLEDGADLAIGSRYVEDGGTRNWPLRRRVLSRLSNALARRLLRLPAHDATAGFRAWRAELLVAIDVGGVSSDGYAFLVWRAARVGARVVERPIVFVDRRDGISKMSGREIRQGALTLFRLRRLAQSSAPSAGRPVELHA